MNHARAHAVPLRLIDGGLVNVARVSLVARMAAVLVRCDAYSDHDEAFETLRAWGFSTADIVMCIDDVRQVAAQHVVAREMSEPC